MLLNFWGNVRNNFHMSLSFLYIQTYVHIYVICLFICAVVTEHPPITCISLHTYNLFALVTIDI